MDAMVFQHWKQLRYYRINAYIPRSIQDVILREIKSILNTRFGLDISPKIILGGNTSTL